MRKEHNYYLAGKLKEFIEENREQIADDEKAVIPYLKREEKETKQIYREVLGEDIEYVVFTRRTRSKVEKDFYARIIFLTGFLIYMLGVVVLVALSAVFNIDGKWISFATYLGSVGGLVCAYYVLESAFKMKKISFLLLGIFILLINGYFVYEQIIEWGIWF